MQNSILSIVSAYYFSLFFSVAKPRNIATEHVTYYSGPVSSPSQFGYSIVAQQSKDLITLWVGAPKYSVETQASSFVKPGKVFRCTLDTNKPRKSNENFQCSALDFKAIESGNQEEKSESKFGETALNLNNCTLDLCGLSLTNASTFNWTKNESPKTANRREIRICMDSSFEGQKNRQYIITGPPSFTIHEDYLFASSKYALARGALQESIMMSPLVETRRGHEQCLRFCFNAFTRVKSANRSLDVWMQYLDDNGELNSTRHSLFNFASLNQSWGLYWNHTEVNIKGIYDRPYRIYFKATIHPYYRYRESRFCSKIPSSSDIVLSDITVTNLPCAEEESNVDEIREEQSIGINLESKQEKGNLLSIASCAPLYQQNCGYAREANGVCYELLVNGTQVNNLRSLKPLTRKCIRGKIDVVLVVDQSGSVNHCNFQKIKRWLRNIVRSFNIGRNEQDVAVIVYSSEKYTSIKIPLGFDDPAFPAAEKKARTINILRNLSYAAGATFTGYAFKIANQELRDRSRNDSKKMIILLTDGETSNKNKKELKEETEKARSKNITILAIGVGGYNEEELVEIAGNKKNVFLVRKFSELEKVYDKLKSLIKIETLEKKNVNQSDASKQQCQMGFSVHYANNNLLMGSPGCYGMSGNVITYEQDNSTFQHNSSLFNFYEAIGVEATTFSPVTASIPSNETTMTASLNTDAKENPSEQRKFVIPSLSEIHNAFGSSLDDSYLGYAVTSGYFFGQNHPRLAAASAPKYQGRGAVLIYHSLLDNSMEERRRLIGQQFGEYFGAVLCAVDLNMDGYTDLLVGAPLHSDSQPDEGRVYLYMGAKNMSSSSDFTLIGDKSAFGRFGSYIATVGDLNKDKYQDLAVSAPLEDRGVVYIFHGSASGLVERYVQKINPRTFRSLPQFDLNKFGPTVAGNIDVDKNGYSDLIIGTPNEDVMTVLLSRPVVHVDAQINTSTEIDARSPGCIDPKNMAEPCFECSICFSYTGFAINTAIGVDFVVTIDSEQRVSRFGFFNTSLSSIESKVVLPHANLKICKHFSWNLKAKIRDLMSSVRIFLSYHLASNHRHHKHNITATAVSSGEPPMESSGDPPQSNERYYYNNLTIHLDDDISEPEENVNLDPIMAREDKKTMTKTIPFKTYCNSIDQCKADVLVLTEMLDKVGNRLDEIQIGITEQKLYLRVTITNLGPEDAYDVKLTLKFSDSLFINNIKKVVQASQKTIDIAFCRR